MYTINVNYENTTIKIRYNPEDNESLSNILIKNNIFLNTACGGYGTCGKCAVRISDGNNTFNTLSCNYYPKESIDVYIPESSLNTNIQEHIPAVSDNTSCNTTPYMPGHISIAADIGSTSISICLNNNDTSIGSCTFSNPTIPYGADIISRIHSSMSGKQGELAALLRSGINNAIMLLLKRNNIDPKDLSEVVISCNNTMQHILMDLDCTSLSAYPFESHNTTFEPQPYNTLLNSARTYEPFMENCTAPIHIIRSFSAFTGGDIISGLYSLGLYDSDKSFILLDFGTNAEMVIGNGSRMLCTSAAAGPAFEAASLSCGCAFAPGGIDDITISRNSSGTYKVKYTTIQNRLPIGICGSGILNLVSQLLEFGLIDSYGTLAEQYLHTGFIIARGRGYDICLTQKDIRELQLAISAIRTGIDILLTEAHMLPSDIDTVYISGSFGSALDFNRIRNLNILKPEWLTRPGTIKSSGNTSLNGAIKYSNDSLADIKINNIISKLDEVLLAGHDSFNKLFMDNINFI